tara:strand:+ start:5400 stop:5903 length:504 start_codon:yes stop_codon:yes gene_type:complete
MKFDSLLFPLLLCSAVLLLACQTNEPLGSSAEHQDSPCPTRLIELDTLFQQGVLPGRASNLIKQRMYWLEGSLADQPVDESIDWVLAVDSMLIPMRARTLQDGRLRWSGSRSFYTPVTKGMSILEETVLESHVWDLEGRAVLLARSESDCWSAFPAAWVVKETIAAP